MSKTLPIGYIPEGAKIERPFVLNWAEDGAKAKFCGSTPVAADTCFYEMVEAGHVPKLTETVGTTASPFGGETADTTF
jgi:hypothetical protein